MAAYGPQSLARNHLVSLNLRDQGRNGVQSKHVHPLEASLLIVADEGHDLSPFRSIRRITADHHYDLALNIAIAGRYTVLLNGWKQEPATGRIDFAQEDITSLTCAWRVITEQELDTAAEFLAGGVV